MFAFALMAGVANSNPGNRSGTCIISHMNSGYYGYCDICDAYTDEDSCESARSEFDCCEWIWDDAPCKFPLSNNVSGAGCACERGYTGIVYHRYGAYSDHTLWGTDGGTWTPGPQQAAAECELVSCGVCYNIDYTGEHPQIFCYEPFLNHVDGPGCGCADGYAGTVWYEPYAVNPSVWTVDGPGWDGPEKYGGSHGSLDWRCYEAPCNIENSNNKSGPDCACADGYSGNITWSGITPECACAKEGPSCPCAGSWEGVCTATEAQLSRDIGNQSKGAMFTVLMVLLWSSAGIGMIIARSRPPIIHQTQLLG